MAAPIVRPNGTTGTLTIAGSTYACALGSGGVVAADAKREGDGATPAGRWKLRAGFYRADRLAMPKGRSPSGLSNPT